VKDLTTGKTVRQISPLAPGEYIIAAALESPPDGKKTAAVSYFTVAPTQAE
jgi:hypothetical protein